jgi:5,10-methylenetetrahydromethanopterin reductase
MRIGLWVSADEKKPLQDALDRLVQAEKDGFASAWMPNIFGPDALTVLALAGRVTSRIELATAVVPTYPRHPVALAQQAMTVQAATGGRLALGLGPSHRLTIETMLGLSYEKPARHIREYLTVLTALRDHGQASFEGETYRVQANLRVTGCDRFPILIGALAPLMLKVAGDLADGTITWLAGRQVLEKKIVPAITHRAQAAGRPAPRIVVALPICVTDDAAEAREAASKLFGFYGTLPSYRAVLDAEGVEGPVDVAVIGSEKEVEASIGRLASVGATDFAPAIFPSGPDPRTSSARTYALLKSLAKKNA